MKSAMHLIIAFVVGCTAEIPDYVFDDIADHQNPKTRSIISESADALRTESTFSIDPFLSRKGLEHLQRDILSTPYKHQQIERTVFQDMGDPAFPANHSRNRIGVVSLGYTNRDAAPESYEQLYAHPPVLELLRAIVEESGIYAQRAQATNQDLMPPSNTLWPSQDPKGGIYSLFLENGDQDNWHYDEAAFSCVLMVQKPEVGGILQYIQLDPSEPDHAFWDRLQSVWDNDIETRDVIGSVEVNEGGLYCFTGNTTLHTVTKVHGNRSRAVIVMTFATESNFKHSNAINEINFSQFGTDKIVNPVDNTKERESVCT